MTILKRSKVRKEFETKWEIQEIGKEYKTHVQDGWNYETKTKNNIPGKLFLKWKQNLKQHSETHCVSGKINRVIRRYSIFLLITELYRKMERNSFEYLGTYKKKRKSNVLSDFLGVELYTRRQWSDIFKILKRKKIIDFISSQTDFQV